jgi:AcrR family transcriptional regulator
MPHGRFARWALERSETEDALAIAHQHELHQLAAKRTDTIVEKEVTAFGAALDLRFRIDHVLLLLVNMFTNNVKSKRRGRPRGRTPQGDAGRQRLYDIGIRLMAQQGYEKTTLRDVAKEAGVSVGLLYRYFPSKRAIVLALYDELSAEYVRKAKEIHPGKWRDRFIFALKTSLHVIDPHRITLRALMPVAVGDGEEGLFDQSAATSRLPVQKVFQEAVVGSTDAPAQKLAEALGRLLYLVHLAVLLWWLIDRSSNQRATAALVSLIQQILPSVSLTLRLPPVRRFMISADELVGEALFTDWTERPGAVT